MAKAFNFSLQKVLDVRQTLENKQAIELNKAQVALHREQDKLNDLQQEKHQRLEPERGKDNAKQSINLNALRVNNDYIYQLNEKIRHQSHEVKKPDEQVSAEREKLLHAARDKKVVELLREKYLANYKKLRNSEENKTQDEVAIRTSQKKG